MGVEPITDGKRTDAARKEENRGASKREGMEETEAIELREVMEGGTRKAESKQE